MKEKSKNKVVTIIFCLVLFIVLFLNIYIKDEEISSSERRKLAQFPDISIDYLLTGKLSNDFEEYAMDQFISRDSFRTAKSYISLEVMKRKDNNKLFIQNEHIFKLEYPLSENSIKNATEKINKICKKYFNEGNNIYYSIIPDKNYFLDDSYLKMDYKKLEKIMNNNLKDLTYIDIFPLLKLEDYYKTDTHWKQENLVKVVDKISKEMKIKERIQTKFQKQSKGSFYGVYYGQLGRSVEPDTISYLTNKIIKESITYNYETNQEGKIYDETKWKTSLDKYDYYLSGAVSLLEITNPNSKTEKELIVFRDSFGSSIIPLLTEAYSKITIVDTRYISSDYLERYLKITNQDVLFLYSTLILNQSNILK